MKLYNYEFLCNCLAEVLWTVARPLSVQLPRAKKGAHQKVEYIQWVFAYCCSGGCVQSDCGLLQVCWSNKSSTCTIRYCPTQMYMLCQTPPTASLFILWGEGARVKWRRRGLLESHCHFWRCSREMVHMVVPVCPLMCTFMLNSCVGIYSQSIMGHVKNNEAPPNSTYQGNLFGSGVFCTWLHESGGSFFTFHDHFVTLLLHYFWHDPYARPLAVQYLCLFVCNHGCMQSIFFFFFLILGNKWVIKLPTLITIHMYFLDFC